MDTRTLLKPVPEGETRYSDSVEDREAVREQLVRLLSSSVFTRSKGCSNLLSHIVSRTLEGRVDHLKERTLGAEVFGRTPDYDTAIDHVVRSTAADVRKRLAQYYMEPGHAGEIRIEIPLGSYVPRFVRSIALPTPLAPDGSDAANGPARSGAAVRFWQRRHAGVLIGLAAAVVLSTLAISSTVLRSSGRTLNGFWRPVTESQNSVLVCISPLATQAGSDIVSGEEPSAGAIRGSGKVFLDDAIALSKFVGWLQRNEKAYRILPPSRLTFSELQTSPAILIGFNNYWTTNLADRLRFTVERSPGNDVAILRDKKNPSRNDWSVNLNTPYDQPTKDYALVVRALDPKTGQITVTAAGLTHFGTLAAAQFLTDPAQIRQLDAFGPAGWERGNVAIVLSTDVIKGSPGSARIVATDFWPY